MNFPRITKYNLSNIIITAQEVSRLFNGLDPKLATGSGKIPVINNINSELSQFTGKIIQKLLPKPVESPSQVCGKGQAFSQFSKMRECDIPPPNKDPSVSTMSSGNSFDAIINKRVIEPLEKNTLFSDMP